MDANINAHTLKMFTRFLLFSLCRLKSNLQFACAKFASCSLPSKLFVIYVQSDNWILSLRKSVCVCGGVCVWECVFVVGGLELCAKLAYLTFQWANICTNTNRNTSTKTCKVCFTHRCCVFIHVWVCVCPWVPKMASCQSKNDSLSTRTWASLLLPSLLRIYLSALVS